MAIGAALLAVGFLVDDTGGWHAVPGGPVRAYCYQGLATGYVRTEHGPRTFDGTSIYTDEAIAAGGWDIPLGSYVDVDGVGTFRIADRGHLANGQVDVATWDRPSAFAITGVRQICVTPPGGN